MLFRYLSFAIFSFPPEQVLLIFIASKLFPFIVKGVSKGRLNVYYLSMYWWILRTFSIFWFEKPLKYGKSGKWKNEVFSVIVDDWLWTTTKTIIVMSNTIWYGMVWYGGCMNEWNLTFIINSLLRNINEI